MGTHHHHTGHRLRRSIIYSPAVPHSPKYDIFKSCLGNLSQASQRLWSSHENAWPAMHWYWSQSDWSNTYQSGEDRRKEEGSLPHIHANQLILPWYMPDNRYGRSPFPLSLIITLWGSIRKSRNSERSACQVITHHQTSIARTLQDSLSSSSQA